MEYAVTPVVAEVGFQALYRHWDEPNDDTVRKIAVEVYCAMRAAEEAENKKAFAEIFGEQ